jgi:hypothetical protein
MKPEDEAGMNRVLDTLQIPRAVVKKSSPGKVDAPNVQPRPAVQQSPERNSPDVPSLEGQPVKDSALGAAHSLIPSTPQMSSAERSQEPVNFFGVNPGPSTNYPSTHWGFTLPTAESLGSIYANLDSASNYQNEGSISSPDSLPLPPDFAQQPGVMLGQAQNYTDDDSESGEEDEAENDVIEQLSHRIGTLKIAGDGHLRFYGATSNLNLVDVSATQQRQRPDARTVRHDGQDILNHLRVGQPVDQALEDHLVELYFTWQNPSTYVVDKEMFMTARSRWRNDLDDTPFYSEVLTNAMYVFAVIVKHRTNNILGVPSAVRSKHGTTLHLSRSPSRFPNFSRIEPRLFWKLN